MCGINGIYAYHYAANPVDRAELLRTREHMTSRGPDGAGDYVSGDGRVGLGHRRLAIIDLSPSGAQPMLSTDGRYAVTFNGEIYNFRQLRQSLENRGRVFASQSDTEVLLHLYAEKGASMLGELRGMFAFIIWDSLKRELFLARDPYGIKPLYYADDGWTFRFASQVKALMAGGKIAADPDPAGLAGFFLFGSVPEPFTTFEAIRCLPAGCYMTVGATGPRTPVRYHSVAGSWGRQAADPREARAELRAALLDSVRHHLVADVPVGVFLSAGIDSGALLALMRDAGAADIQAVTVAFEEFRGHHHDEAPAAAEMARRYGARHVIHTVTRGEFEADLPRILSSMDQPTIDGVNTWFVAKAAAANGLKVAISGLGGDELFGGYPSFRDLPRWLRMCAVPSRIPLLGRMLRRFMSAAAGPLGLNPKSAGMIEYGGNLAGAYLLRRGLFMPWELGQVLDPDVVRAGLRRLDPLALIGHALEPAPPSRFAKVAALEASLYMRNQLLRDTDWASMAHGLEVRVPLADAVLLERLAPHAATLAAAGGKSLLAEAPSEPLPAAISERRKTGFVTPVETWMRALALPAIRRDEPSRRPEPWARRWSETVFAQPQWKQAA